ITWSTHVSTRWSTDLRYTSGPAAGLCTGVFGTGIGWHGSVIVGNTSVTTEWLIDVDVDDEGWVATVAVGAGVLCFGAPCDFFLSPLHADSASTTTQTHAMLVRIRIRNDSRSPGTSIRVTTTIGPQYCDKEPPAQRPQGAERESDPDSKE